MAVPLTPAAWRHSVAFKEEGRGLFQSGRGSLKPFGEQLMIGGRKVSEGKNHRKERAETQVEKLKDAPRAMPTGADGPPATRSQ